MPNHMIKKIFWGCFFLFIVIVLYFPVRGLVSFVSNFSQMQKKVAVLEKTLREKKEVLYLDNVENFSSDFQSANETPKIYDRNERLIGEFMPPSIYFISRIEDVPQKFLQILVNMEDRNFYHHFGFNPKGMIRALYVNLRYRKGLQGGSSLTQQLARILFDRREASLTRKFFEIYAAIYLETKFSKKDILLLYANFVYFGHGKVGIYQASKFYFGKSPAALSIVENAFLISLIPNPNYYSPFHHLKASKEKVKIVLKKAEEAEIIPKDFHKNQSIENFWASLERQKDPKMNLWPMNVNKTPHYNEYVRRQIQSKMSFKQFLQSSAQIYTGLDLDIDLIAQNVLNKEMKNIRLKNPGAEVAMMTIDNSTGDVISAVGGSDFSIDNQLLRFTQTRRPIGSLAKVIVYLLAANQLNYNANSTVVDEAMTIGNNNGTSWKPNNYDRRFRGVVTLEDAFVQSINIPAIKLLQLTGPALYINYVDKILQTRPKIPNDLSIALGSFSLSVEEVALIMESVANKGDVKGPNYIKYVKSEGNLIAYDKKRNEFPSLITDRHSYEFVDHLLQEVFKKPGGTAYRFYENDKELQTIEVAGKTGTTQQLKDAWFAGYTPKYTVVVWVGQDQNKPLNGSSAQIALPIWTSYVKSVYQFLPKNMIE